MGLHLAAIATVCWTSGSNSWNEGTDLPHNRAGAEKGKSTIGRCTLEEEEFVRPSMNANHNNNDRDNSTD